MLASLSSLPHRDAVPSPPAAGSISAFSWKPARFDQRYRSEEHTSELQSLMRISYAVFCLKKKKNHKNTHILVISQLHISSQKIVHNKRHSHTITHIDFTIHPYRALL